jgi:hypothetical protein
MNLQRKLIERPLSIMKKGRTSWGIGIWRGLPSTPITHISWQKKLAPNQGRWNLWRPRLPFMTLNLSTRTTTAPPNCTTVPQMPIASRKNTKRAMR